ncbi:MAG: YbcC family protein [Myxococcota bacterium]
MTTESVLQSSETSETRDLQSAIKDACGRLAPLWTLRNFVAVNAFMGFSELPFPAAARELKRLFHARCIMPDDYFEAHRKEGRIGELDLSAAVKEVEELTGRKVEPAQLSFEPDVEPFLLYSESMDQKLKTRWSARIHLDLAKFCSAMFDHGQAAWTLPWKNEPLWQAWREFGSLDQYLELQGLKGFRSYVKALPNEPHAAIRHVMQQLEVPPARWTDFLTRALASAPGWAGHVQYLAREAGMAGRTDDRLEHFLAIRVAYEGALHAHLRTQVDEGHDWISPETSPNTPPGPSDGVTAGLVWQYAFEHAFRSRLIQNLNRVTPISARESSAARKRTLQAVFCIDVRSEVFRRHLESLSPEVQTIGFAGFFGFPIEVVEIGDVLGGTRCPVLLNPAASIQKTGEPSSTAAANARDGERTNHRALSTMRLSSVTAYPLAETLGPYFGLRLLTDSVRATRMYPDGALFPSKVDRAASPSLDVSELAGRRVGLTDEERLTMAEGALRNMGLIRDFADVVLLCGHGSDTTNNPYGSGLDCGACGGHAGDTNARVAAMVFNDPKVRQGLAARGIQIPEHTRFVAGLHNTTTDQVTLFDFDGQADETIRKIWTWLQEAGHRTRTERLPGLTRGETERVDAHQEVLKRSRDWSEVRPEWGLARNAAFIAARRSRTSGLNLEGRVFLHDYDHRRDPERKTLELIMIAPMVVAHWINMQYYASTVDNQTLGSGNKVLHNVVGRHGVMQGNRSDLQVGLPFQSVHDGERFYHEPMRLQVFLEAPTADIDTVLHNHPNVRILVDNGWLHLMAIDPDGQTIRRRTVHGSWEVVEAAPDTT